MSDRRMFAKTIIDSDAFLDMPISSQALYFHMSMRADDEGFVNNAKKIIRILGCDDSDMDVLVAKKFVIPFASGIYAIKHWKINNYIRGDRLVQTKYKEERDSLSLDENGSYTMGADTCQADDGQMSAQDRLGKVRLGKDSIDKDNTISTTSINTDSNSISKGYVAGEVPTLDDVKNYCDEIGAEIEPSAFYNAWSKRQWKDAKGKPIGNWKAMLKYQNDKHALPAKKGSTQNVDLSAVQALLREDRERMENRYDN